MRGQRANKDPYFIGLAKDALNVLRTSNAQISRLYMPPVVTRRGRWYNIRGDLPQ